MLQMDKATSEKVRVFQKDYLSFLEEHMLDLGSSQRTLEARKRRIGTHSNKACNSTQRYATGIDQLYLVVEIFDT